MAVYKVIQDVEAEDKLLGPLTFKGLVYIMLTGTLAFIEFELFTAKTPLKWLFIAMIGLPMLLFAVLASPLGREQPTEVWLLSRVRFFLKPRLRLWDQEGVSNLVKITAPPKVEQHLTKDLSQTEVKSRLKTLAVTLDTRGWAIKNVNVNLNDSGGQSGVVNPDSDRLVKRGGVPHEMPVVDVHAADDILDEKNNPTAQKFENMMQRAEVERRTGLLAKLKGTMDADSKPASTTSPIIIPGSVFKPKTQVSKTSSAPLKTNQAQTQDQLADARNKFSKLHSTQKDYLEKPLQPQITSQPPKTSIPNSGPSPVTVGRQTVNMELAQSGSAFSVATLSQLANRQSGFQQTGPNEFTISLH